MTPGDRNVSCDLHFESASDLLDFTVRQMFYPNELVPGVTRGADEFVEFCLNGGRIAILRVLNQENHQESHDRRGCIHDQLPCVGPVEHRPCDYPQQDNEYRQRECCRLAGERGNTRST
jgi:hypothetical protein